MLSNPFIQRDPAEVARILLGYVPDTEQARESLWITDYAHAADLLGLETPDPADDSAVDKYVTDIWQGSGAFQGMYLAGYAWDNEIRRKRQSARKSIGFAQGDISVGVAIGTGDHALEMTFGDIDPAVTSRLIAASAGCPASAEHEYDGPAISRGVKTTRRAL